MKLFINDLAHKDTAAVKDGLKNHSLAFETVLNSDTLKLVDGDKFYLGAKEIISYIDSLEGKLHKWYYCDC